MLEWKIELILILSLKVFLGNNFLLILGLRNY